jgi:hypothetical protein
MTLGGSKTNGSPQLGSERGILWVRTKVTSLWLEYNWFVLDNTEESGTPWSQVQWVDPLVDAKPIKHNQEVHKCNRKEHPGVIS